MQNPSTTDTTDYLGEPDADGQIYLADQLGEVHARPNPNLADHSAAIFCDIDRHYWHAAEIVRRCYPIDAARLSKITGASKHSCAQRLGKACQQGWIMRVRTGIYAPVSHKARLRAADRR